jgi:hypothetical protein
MLDVLLGEYFDNSFFFTLIFNFIFTESPLESFNIFYETDG